MGTIGCPETLVRNYYYSLHNNPEEHRSHISITLSIPLTPSPCLSQVFIQVSENIKEGSFECVSSW
jgi:hypothetical protein